MDVNALFAWCWILVGLLVGAGIGLFFHGEDWLGGYTTWRRRMLRLGHISFLGTGLLNLAYGLTLRNWPIDPEPRLAGYAFIVGAVAMPTVCFLSAWKQGFRHLFVIPVGSLLLAVAVLLWRGSS